MPLTDPRAGTAALSLNGVDHSGEIVQMSLVRRTQLTPFSVLNQENGSLVDVGITTYEVNLRGFLDPANTLPHFRTGSLVAVPFIMTVETGTTFEADFTESMLGIDKTAASRWGLAGAGVLEGDVEVTIAGVA